MKIAKNTKKRPRKRQREAKILTPADFWRFLAASEAAKSRPKSPQERPRAAKRGPREAQDPPKRGPRAPKRAPRVDPRIELFFYYFFRVFCWFLMNFKKNVMFVYKGGGMKKLRVFWGFPGHLFSWYFRSKKLLKIIKKSIKIDKKSIEIESERAWKARLEEKVVQECSGRGKVGIWVPWERHGRGQREGQVAGRLRLGRSSWFWHGFPGHSLARFF